MGQQNSLNCKNNSKDEGKEIQTNQTNALLLMRTLQHKENDPDPNDKKSTTTWSQVDQNTPLTHSHAQKKNYSPPPQHSNILRVSSTPFRGAEKVAGRWVQRVGKSLAQIVEGRYNTNMHFPQSQVVALIESLVYALAYLEKNNIRHHDFYPTNIYYHSGVFKLSNPVSHETSAYTLTQQRQRFSFLSPQLIAQIIEETPAADIPIRIMYKGDVFAIGMIVLEFCTLQQSSECYDEENYSLVDKIIQSRIAKTAKIYSTPIADCISQMLNYDVEQRITPIELALAVFMHAPSQKVDNQDPRNRPQPQPNQNTQPTSQNMQYLQVPGVVPGQPISPQNSVTMPAPNYVYSHIGPNNQSLLSGSALQNKLRIIEKIQEKPQQEQDSEGQPSNITQPSHLSNNSERVQNKPLDKHHPHLQARNSAQRQMPLLQRPLQQQPTPFITQAPLTIQQQGSVQAMVQPPTPQRAHESQTRPQLVPQGERIEERNLQLFPPGSRNVGQVGQGLSMPNFPSPPPTIGFHHGQVFHPPLNYGGPQITNQTAVMSLPEPHNKPNSPPIAVRSNFVAPSSEKQAFASGSIKIQASKQEGMNLDDRMLLSQPTYYEIHGNSTTTLTRSINKQPQGVKPSTFTPKVLEGDNYQFSFKQKFGQPRSDLPEYDSSTQFSREIGIEHRQGGNQRQLNKVDQYQLPSYKPKNENLNVVSQYHSSTSQANYMPSYQPTKDYFEIQQSSKGFSETYQKKKYSLAKDYQVPGNEGSQSNKYGVGSRDEGGETLEQRVDRILQISRSIK